MSSPAHKPTTAPGRNITLIIIKVLAAAIALGVVGGVVWSFAKTPDTPAAADHQPTTKVADMTGTHPQSSARGGQITHSQQSSSTGATGDQSKTTGSLFSISRFLATIKANWPLAIVSLLVVVSMTVAITVAVTMLSVKQSEPVLVEDPHTVVAEEPEATPIWFMVAVSVGAMLVSFAAGFATSWAITWFKGRPAGQALKIPDYPEPAGESAVAREKLAAELFALKNYRLTMKESEKCKLAAFPGSIPLTLVKGDGTTKPIYCPNGFTLNSVWWAAREEAGDADSGALGDHVVKYTPDGFRTIQVDVKNDNVGVAETTRELIWLHYHPLSNIPGHNGFPVMPVSSAEPSDQEWKEWTDKCAAVEAFSPVSTAEFVNEVRATRSSSTTIMYSKTEPTVMSVLCALLKAYSTEKLSVQQVGTFDFKISEANAQRLWMMREPFKIQSQDHAWVSQRIYE